MLRSIVEADSDVNFILGSTTDFGVAADAVSPANVVAPGAEWGDTMGSGHDWGDGSGSGPEDWAAGTVQLRTWRVTNEIGVAISTRLKSTTKGANVALFSTDVIYEKTAGLA